MVYVFDVEVYPAFFSIVLLSIDQKKKHVLYMYKNHNDIDHIHKLFMNKDNWFVGFNSSDYDDLIMEMILLSYNRYSKIPCSQTTNEIFKYSSKIINSDNYKYTKGLFNSFDLMRVAAIFKSLKMVGVDLKHNKIQDLPYPFNHDVQDDEVQSILDYMVNDGEITLKLYNDQKKKIILRQQLSQKYGQNLMNYPDSGIANRILERDYESFSGIPSNIFKNKNTQRDLVYFKDCIADNVSFESDYLKSFLEKIKNDSADKDTKIEYNVRIGHTVYDIKKGGIHSNRDPEIFVSDDKYIIKDCDVTSFYPYIMILLQIIPSHLHKSFISLMQSYVNVRVKAKKDGDKTAADGLKIVVNSIFGKMGSDVHWLYDLEAMYKVTLNGQLYLLMLIEKLELSGIKVFYANTDGITAKVPVDKIDKYNSICKDWEKYTGFQLEFEEYKKCLIRDCNNYLWLPVTGEPKYKGFFDINRHEDVAKGYDKPVIPLAISKWFIEDEPIEKSIFEHDDILDFCMAQKPGEKFNIFFDQIIDGKLTTKRQQKTNRYYVGKKGGALYKDDGNRKTSLVAKEPVHIINDVSDLNAKNYPIKYSYYIKEANKIIRLFNNNQTDLFL